MIIFIQIAKWFWSLFPALIGIIGPTGAYNQQNNLDLQQSQLVANSDLTVDSNSDGIPDGFSYANTTDISLTNGIAKFTATAYLGNLQYSLSDIKSQTMYIFARFKTDSDKVRLHNAPSSSYVFHSGSGQFEFLSVINNLPNNSISYPQVSDSRSSDWTPIEVDYIGAINLTAVFGDNIPDKQVLDDFILSGERFLFTDEVTSDSWFNTGFTSESRDILDIIGYFFWLAIPVITIYWVFRLLIQII